MTSAEIFLTSRYAAAELAGALLLGKYARKTKDDYLRKNLTLHCYQEAGHAWKWTEVLKRKNLPLLEIHEKSEFFSYSKELSSDIEFLAWTHVYELRGEFHLKTHMAIERMDDDLRNAMHDILESEEAHLDWIGAYLAKLQKEGHEEIADYVQKWGAIENKTYLEFVEKLLSAKDTGLVEVGDLLKKNLPQYEFKWKALTAVHKI